MGTKGVSPEGERCGTGAQDASVRGVEKTWEISGAAANWTMTVSILGLEDGDLALPDFEGLVEHFRTVIDLTETLWQLRQVG